jgi:NDP-sugar pyrophosphorylase family protein
MKAMILAAGFGTRFRPVTHTLPKPMVPLLNKPLIGWATESLLSAGVNEIIVNLHHLPEALERYLVETYARRAKFQFSFEEEILGTGGGVRRVRPLLESEEDFFLVNGDTVQFPPWNSLRGARRSRNALAAITLRHPPEDDRFTPVYFEDGFITGFGRGTGRPLMFSGAHVISSRIFQHLPDKEFSGIVDEVYQPVIDSGAERLAGLVHDGLWFDIGTPRRYLSAMRDLLNAGLGEAVPERSTVGARSVVEGTIRDTAVWDDCVIGAGVVLERCIVAHGVELRGPQTLADSLVTQGAITPI